MRIPIKDIDYFVRYIPLPRHVGGATMLNPDGTYSVYINSLLPVELQWKAYLHELTHIQRGHLDERKELPECVKEWEADHFTPCLAEVC